MRIVLLSMLMLGSSLQAGRRELEKYTPKLHPQDVISFLDTKTHGQSLLSANVLSDHGKAQKYTELRTRIEREPAEYFQTVVYALAMLMFPRGDENQRRFFLSRQQSEWQAGMATPEAYFKKRLSDIFSSLNADERARLRDCYREFGCELRSLLALTPQYNLGAAALDEMVRAYALRSITYSPFDRVVARPEFMALIVVTVACLAPRDEPWSISTYASIGGFTALVYIIEYCMQWMEHTQAEARYQEAFGRYQVPLPREHDAASASKKKDS